MNSLGQLAFLAPFVLFWNQAKGFLVTAFSFFIKSEIIDCHSPALFIDFIKRKSVEINVGNVRYCQTNPYSIKTNEYKFNIFILKSRYIFLYKKIFPIFLTIKGNAVNATYLNIFSFRKLLKKYNTEYNNYDKSNRDNHNKNRFYIEKKFGKFGEIEKFNNNQSPSGTSLVSPASDTLTGFHYPKYDFLNVTPCITEEHEFITLSPPKTNYSKYFFSKEVESAYKDVKKWLESKEWYEKREISWRRSCLFYGLPGTGKSEGIKQIAKKLGIPIIIFDLASMNNKEFEEHIKNCEQGSVILFEDIDRVFHGQKNLTKTENFQGLTYDCLLNVLGGVNNLTGLYIFITCNDITKLDDALLRPGRLDTKVEIGTLPKDGKRFIASKILDEYPELIEGLVDGEEKTAAEFENKCVELALQKFWEKPVDNFEF